MKDESFNKVFIGSGLIAENLLHALIHHKGESTDDFYVLGKKLDRCKALMEKYNIRATTNFNAFISKAKVVVLAVDVNDVGDIPEIAESIRDKVPPDALINSVTPTLKIKEIEKYFPNHPVMRLGINIATITGTGVGTFCCGSVSPADTAPVARFLIESLGELIEVNNEEEFERTWDIIHAQTCGAYMTLTCLIDSGIKAGLTPEQARKIAIGVNRGVTTTLDLKRNDEFLNRILDYTETIRSGLKLLHDYGFIQNIDQATHMNSEDFQANLERMRKAELEDVEKYEFHYRHW